MTRRGSIQSEEAYAQGKMLDHSSWSLPRNITPSDVDFHFDANGRILYCELSSHNRLWSDLKDGQCRSYKNMVKNSRHCAVLCLHDVKLPNKINTTTDIIGFSPMIWHSGHWWFGPFLEGNPRWQTFVQKWIKETDHIFEFLIKRDVREIKPAATPPTDPPSPVSLDHLVRTCHQCNKPHDGTEREILIGSFLGWLHPGCESAFMERVRR